jgi:glycine/sarcosine N-methyltransferase
MSTNSYLKEGEMYTELAPHYDHFVNWKARLEFELPFLQQQVRSLGIDPTKVKLIDTACGTGQHAIALSAEGYQVSACDIAPAMVAIAQANAAAAFQKVDFKTVGFTKISQAFKNQQFDVIFCLGNSLPHVEDLQELTKTLQDFCQLMRGTGVLVLQMRNFSRLLKNKERWLEPQAFAEGNEEFLFQRFYDFEPDGHIQFNMVSLERKKQGPWESQVISSMLLPIQRAQLESILLDCGFGRLQSYGSMDGQPFEEASSEDLVMTARKLA